MVNVLKYLISKDEKFKDLIITSIEYMASENLLCMKLQYTCDVFLDSDKQYLEKELLTYFNNKFDIECKLKKYLIDEDVIRDYVIKYIEDKFPSVTNNNTKIKRIQSGFYKVVIELNVENYAYLKTLDFEERLNSYLQEITKEEYEIVLKEKNYSEDSNVDILEERFQLINNSDNLQVIDYEPIEIKNIENLIGTLDVDFVYPIASYNTADKVVLAGEISHVRVSEYESRFKNKDGSAKLNKRVNFNLNDGSGKINCVYFPVIADVEKIDSIIDGMRVVVSGELEDREGLLSLKIKSVSKCEFDTYVIEEKPVELKTVNAEYKYIFPKAFENNTQSDFLTGAEKVDQFLMDNDVVVFDLETTGLNVNECEIIEIGAVKMRRGQVIETFDTLIKPTNPIPADATAINNITNEMVQDALSIEKVMQDFYKFIDGCVLVAYNIAYDYGCLKAYGDKNGYVFDHKQVDALKLAKKALPQYKSHKLGKVVKILGITLDNAHRALFDTIATAEVLKVTLNMLSEEDKKVILG